MHELAKVTLENEMDLILAHKRSMKLAEITGLSLSAQTTFATAVSEVARTTIESGRSGCLVLNVAADQREKYIVACLKNEGTAPLSREGLDNARRLVSKCNVSANDTETSVELFYYIAPSFRIDIHRLDEWRSLFRNEPPISPYEELKRKNEQLQELSEKVQKSEAQYKTLTNALPLIIFSIEAAGTLIYANDWLTTFTGATVESLNRTRWKSVVHPDDSEAFLRLLQNDEEEAGLQLQCRFRHAGSGDFLWHQVSLTPFRDDAGTLQYRIGYIVDIHAQKSLEETLKDNIELKQTQARLKEYQHAQEQYIEELNRSNRELQQFAFVASHDLQEPVRKLLFYSDYLLTRHAGTFEGKGIDYLNSMQQSARRMRTLIKDLLVFSQIKKDDIAFEPVDLNRIVREARQDFEMAIEEKGATLHTDDLPVVNADERMMRQLFENLISNALKYSKDGVPPELSIHCVSTETGIELEFRDNGIGFDEQYTAQMFTLFQRLHNRTHYEGTGLGLAICKKIVELHNGSIRAKGKEGSGASFYVLLPGNSL